MSIENSLPPEGVPPRAYAEYLRRMSAAHQDMSDALLAFAKAVDPTLIKTPVAREWAMERRRPFSGGRLVDLFDLINRFEVRHYEAAAKELGYTIAPNKHLGVTVVRDEDGVYRLTSKGIERLRALRAKGHHGDEDFVDYAAERLGLQEYEIANVTAARALD